MATGGERHLGDDRRPTVRVLGQAAIRTEPDEAIVWLTLTALESSAGVALADVAARSRELGVLLDELGVPASDRSTTGVTVSEEFDHARGGMRSLGHRASATTVTRLVDNERIGQTIMRATTELDARVLGPRWTVSPGNPAWMDAARQASANAREKAAAYATGVEVRLGALLELSEPGDPRMSAGPMRMMARAASSAEMPVDAGEQDVVAAVWAEFELLAPD